MNKKPLNPYYYSFEGCERMMKSRVNKMLVLNTPLYENKIKVIAVTREDLGVPKSSFDDGLLVIKGERGGDIKYEDVEFEKVMSEPNKWGNGNDGLVIYYTDRKDFKKKVDKYALMEGPEVVEWIKREEGVYDASKGIYNFKVVEFEDSLYSF